MGAISFNPSYSHQVSQTCPKKGFVVDEIEGLIRVYKDGRVERPPLIPNVTSTTSPDSGIAAKDVIIDKPTNLWVRIYAPNRPRGRLPLFVYFHGGGFCIGSAAWSCYHEFLANLASMANCVIVSVNYRLSPENRLPAAYEDGTKVLTWIKQVAAAGSNEHHWWMSQCNLSSMYLAGDSAGANVAYNVSVRVESSLLGLLKGVILVQPFFGGESRTGSERQLSQLAGSALTLSASDTYWRLSLPSGANRDHPWCNPLSNNSSTRDFHVPSLLICVAELDILKDRNLSFGAAMAKSAKVGVQTVVLKGVGHAFQVLQNSTLARTRTQELISHVKSFISR